MQNDFVDAIRNKNKVRIRFYSKDDGRFLERVCAPMDYGPSRRAHNKSDRYHLWDFESDKVNHTLSLLPNQIDNMEVLEEHFDPAEFVTWDTTSRPWFVERNWGQYS